MKISKKAIYKRLIFAAALYAAIVILMFVFQRDFLYLPSGKYRTPQELGLKDISEVTLKTDDGLELISWYKAPAANAKTIVYFHGNAGNLTRRDDLFKKITKRDYGLLGLEYRGFSNNRGSPSEEGLYLDARAAIDFLQTEKNIKQQDMILFGRSLGSGIAVQMATEYDVDSVVLISPYDSIPSVAQHLYWYLPAKYLLKDKFDSAAKADKIEEPVYIFHGVLDTVIPIENGRSLFLKINAPKEFYEMQDQGHNHINFNFVLDALSENKK